MILTSAGIISDRYKLNSFEFYFIVMTNDD